CFFNVSRLSPSGRGAVCACAIPPSAARSNKQKVVMIILFICASPLLKGTEARSIAMRSCSSYLPGREVTMDYEPLAPQNRNPVRERFFRVERCRVWDHQKNQSG